MKAVRFGLAFLVLTIAGILLLLMIPDQITRGHFGLLMLGLIVVAILLGFPTAFTLMGLGMLFGFIALYRSGQPWLSNPVFDQMVLRTFGVMTNDVVISVPLFVFMGYLIERANIIDRLFRALQLSMSRLPGSLAVATILTCTVFATATGDDDNQVISDSRLIVNRLKEKYGDIDKGKPSSEQKGIAKAFERLLEEHLYWAGMVTRWDYNESNWQVNKQAIFGVLPPIIRDVAAWIYRRKIKSQILGHGMGRLNHQEVFELGKEDIDSLALFLGNKTYFMGEEPTSIDPSAHGILVNILACPIESPLKENALRHKNLYDYCRRMQSEFFSELSWPADI